jgi:hypothetical protein
MEIQNKIPEGVCTCSVCGETKPNEEFTFYKDRFTKDGNRLRTNTNCKDCQRKRSKERTSLKYEKPEYGRPCECCGEPVFKNWQLDHDHDNGKFRGWLCKKCNTGIGLIGDNITGALKVLLYLIKTKIKSKFKK